MTTLQKVQNLINCAAYKVGNTLGNERMTHIQLHTQGYSEPGYQNPESGVIATGNWNDITRWNHEGNDQEVLSDVPSRIGAVLYKRYGVETEWEDEWDTCSKCGKLVRTQPDSYSWKPYFQDLDGERLCGDCIKADPSDYLSELEGNERKADVFDLDLAKFGYVKVEGEFENGLHEGMADDPRKIAATLRAKGIKRFIFSLDQSSQFYVSFSAWVHKDEADKIPAFLTPAEREKDGLSPADAMKLALAKGALQAAGLQGPGITVVKCHADGTATVKKVSPQDFVEGRALDDE